MADIKILGGLLKRVGTFNMDSFEGRLIFQKTVYFMQVFGLYLGYPYSWYLYGPYSPKLTEDGFKLMEIYERMPKVKFRKNENEEKFRRCLSFLGERKSDPEWLELTASLHFLKRMYPNLAKERIIKKVKKKQPYFSKRQCEATWSDLRKYKQI